MPYIVASHEVVEEFLKEWNAAHAVKLTAEPVRCGVEDPAAWRLAVADSAERRNRLPAYHAN